MLVTFFIYLLHLHIIKVADVHNQKIKCIEYIIYGHDK